MHHDIFISYSSKQKSIADGVCHYLEENGFKCWMAPRDIPVGSEYGDLIEEAIKACKAVVLVFSEAASISKWVKGEINVAFTEDKPILPFRVDETEIKGGFRVMLNQMHWIDAYPHYVDRLPDLLNSISGLLGRHSKNVNVERDILKTIGGKPNRSEKPANSFNGHEYVDLGLPSGTLWATCNVGSSKPEDYGDYYSWDEGSRVAAQWGNGWSMPTKEQWNELKGYAKSIWTTKNGVKGRLFSASNGQSLFLPAAGNRYGGSLCGVGRRCYYWLGSLYTDRPNFAWGLDISSHSCDMNYNYYSSGFSVRLVCSSH